MRTRLEAMLAAGRDDALLRFGLGNACLQTGDAAAAIPHLQRAVAHQPDYSAAWKLLGKALLAQSQVDAAAEAWTHGIDAATRAGDVQSAKEMAVFLRRLTRDSAAGP
ncbi:MULTISPECIES: tetratricopeptide repeat protein [Luteimonas]|uniref:tetratricopeptide repeat protein n=1 Tax=Luteimonas TaxID=83614 RepID=UPI000C7B8E67|nr:MULTISPECIES: tetratricopeptide repeat protein [Luteimonas]